jgi:AAA+ superfamily predicted ATPase
MAAQTGKDKDDRTAYPSNLRYLSDELERIELLLKLRLLKDEKRQSQTQPNQFKGLVLLKEEIAELLGKPPSGDLIENDSNYQTLSGALTQLEKQITGRRDASLTGGIYLPLPHLSRLFNLTRFEESCLLVCLAPEIDRKYEKIYAYLQDDVTSKSPGVDLFVRLLSDAMEERLQARAAFESQAALLKFRLLHPIDNSPGGPTTLLSQAFKLDARIADFLLGSGQMDSQLDRVASLSAGRAIKPGLCVAEEARSRIGKIIELHRKQSQSKATFYIFGPYGSGKRSLAKSVCYDLGLSLITCDAADLIKQQASFDELAWRLGREAGLQPAALCIENLDCLLDDGDQQHARLESLLEAIRAFSSFTFLLGKRFWTPQGLPSGDTFIHVELPSPDYATRITVWEHYFKSGYQAKENVDIKAVATKFRFTPGQIQDAMIEAQNIARWRSPDDPRITADDLYAACRSQATLNLGALARKIEPKYTWQEIILPPDEIAQLGELCDQARKRETVYGKWGFDRKLSLGKGINALFFGPPGTGKTMAAEVIASELKLDMYKIDLSQIVSKYIGETEKNLHNIFKQAESSDAILFFDEADALFGKRSEVKDAHDRYANIEIAYLLQKMEEYDGIAILATNLRQNMDDAFVRRLRFIVEFPFPDEEYRRRIWEVTFPKEAPLAADVDFQRLAREIRLAGGNIKNIAVAAAFYAASDGGVIQMSQLMRAAHREHRKVGRIWNPT